MASIKGYILQKDGRTFRSEATEVYKDRTAKVNTWKLEGRRNPLGFRVMALGEKDKPQAHDCFVPDEPIPFAPPTVVPPPAAPAAPSSGAGMARLATPVGPGTSLRHIPVQIVTKSSEATLAGLAALNEIAAGIRTDIATLRSEQHTTLDALGDAVAARFELLEQRALPVLDALDVIVRAALASPEIDGDEVPPALRPALVMARAAMGIPPPTPAPVAPVEAAPPPAVLIPDPPRQVLEAVPVAAEEPEGRGDVVDAEFSPTR